MITSFLLAFGFGLGPITGGLIGQRLPYPLTVTYIPTLIRGALAIYALMRLDLEAHTATETLGWRTFMPRLAWTAASDSQAYIRSCASPIFTLREGGLS